MDREQPAELILKLPKYVATRWNTLVSCGIFINENKDRIDSFIAERMQVERTEYQQNLIAFQKGRKRTEPEVPSPPPVLKVPPTWKDHTEALNVIADFTNKIEGDLVLQQELYVSYIGVEASLERMAIRGNAVAQETL